jgi:glycosyltransferase involved in cell wall biosynthesis
MKYPLYLNGNNTMPETNRLKIAIIYDVIYPYVKGGVEKRVWELAIRLSRRGHDVHLYGMKFWEGNDIIFREDVTLHGICTAQHLYSHGRRTIHEAISFGIALFFQLRKENYDIIDCQQFPYLSCIAAKYSRANNKIPLVITWHEVWGAYWYTYLGIAGILGKFIEWWVSRLTVSAVAVSATTAKNLMNLNNQTNVRIIQNGVDLKRINTILPHDETCDIIFVGRLIKEKHVDLLVHAMGILSRENKKYQLLIIGEGPERERIVQLIRECSLDHHVRLIRFQENHDTILAHIKSAKICVLPSTREGFGIAALEALACGLPVVTVDHPANAIRDLISEKTGFICTLSVPDLINKIHTALEHHAEMKAACIASAASFDWDHITADVEDYYLSVIERHDEEK